MRAKGASLKATEQPIDTSTAAGKCFLDMLGVFAEFETNLRRERQLRCAARGRPAAPSPHVDATRPDGSRYWVLLPRQPVTGGAELDPYRLVTPE